MKNKLLLITIISICIQTTPTFKTRFFQYIKKHKKSIALNGFFWIGIPIYSYDPSRLSAELWCESLDGSNSNNYTLTILDSNGNPAQGTKVLQKARNDLEFYAKLTNQKPFGPVILPLAYSILSARNNLRKYYNGYNLKDCEYEICTARQMMARSTSTKPFQKISSNAKSPSYIKRFFTN